MAVIAPSRLDVPVNLLPQEIKSEQRVRRVFGIAAAGALALVVLLGTVTVVQRMQVASSERTLAAEQTKAAALRTEVGQLREFEVLQASIVNNRRLLGGALNADIAWSRFLDDLDTTMPADAWLTGMTVSGKPGVTALGEPSLGTAQYQGFVTSMPALAGWLDKMSTIKGLRFVYLSNGTKQDQNGRSVISFTATAHLTEQMLSGRCQGEGSSCP
ncbi:MAG: PilN domain-containing protein [Actinomycetota bacterium]